MFVILGFVLLSLAYTHALPPCVCTRDMKPVCGSDGETYGNQCMLECAATTKPGLTTARVGSCSMPHGLQPDGPVPPACICTFIYAPVCGTDGRTYPNDCAVKCERLTRNDLEVKHRGACTEEVKVANLPTCICGKDRKQVCGTDGKSYESPCLLNCARDFNEDLHIDHVGPCAAPREQVKVVEQAQNACTCTRDLKPVCGTDKNTYNNICLLECAKPRVQGLAKDHDGFCEDKVLVVENA